MKALVGHRVVRLAFAATTAAGAMTAWSGPAAQASDNSTPPAISIGHCADGIDALTVTPAASFDPTTASPAELRLNHLPQRPSNLADVAAWIRYVTGPIDRVTTCAETTPQTDLQPGGPSIPSQTEGSASAQTSDNWAGNIAQSHPYDYAEATWSVPSATSKTNAYSSQWVGIGSGSSSTAQLYQAGTEVDGNGNKQVFWESYPAINQQLTKNVSTGDVMDVDVDLGGKGNYATFDVSDRTQSWSATYRVSQVNNPASAEFIDERTTENNTLRLYTHQSTRFQDTLLDWGSGSGSINDVPHVYDNMYDKCNTELANTQGIDSSGSYTVNWDAYGVADSSSCP